jgi:altronate dehydratase
MQGQGATVTKHYAFEEIARLPDPEDNVAIATRRLEAGTQIRYLGQQLTLDATVLEGHRFAVQGIGQGATLLSWGMPFGVARQAIEAGSALCNASTLEALRGRSIDLVLPAAANFEDRIEPYQLDEASFRAAEQISLQDGGPTFQGYERSGGRGVGTRNTVVLLGTTSLTASYVERLAARFDGVSEAHPDLDGVVAVAHTEGAAGKRPNNLELLLRTLAGFMVHPNVAAVLAVDEGTGAVSNQMLRGYLLEHGYPLAEVPHHFLTLSGGFQEDLVLGEEIVKGWLEAAGRAERSEVPLSALKLALQCGGSDAFSGVSGNPLAAWVAREVIRYGGAANLAETDELIGAEAYVLERVADLATARKFLMMVERFKERAAWHGTSAEGNPSGGNKFRGLYNIVLKSLGAATKKHPEIRLDTVLDYGEPMRGRGYYFMDSPGNDLESIAGQVASGANLIYFVTGNGSITNFPFVPTVKIVTTTGRYELLEKEMDVNAGAYLDGTPMEELGAQTLQRTLEVASGARSVGERAGHAQLQIWRDWPQADGSELGVLLDRAQPDGNPLPLQTFQETTEPIVTTDPRPRGGHLGLILPTSLCAGQIARMAAERLNRRGLGRDKHLLRFAALLHTEGCGVSSGSETEALHARTLLGYLTHPSVRHALLLEHGCEKTHNDYMRHQLIRMGLEPEHFGWASIQLDGGIDKVLHNIDRWFETALEREGEVQVAERSNLQLALRSSGPVSPEVGFRFAEIARAVVAASGTVVVPANDGLLAARTFLEPTLGARAVTPTLAYGQRISSQGLHVMETPSDHWVETLTGLGATGVEVVLAHIADRPRQGHPLVPVLQGTRDAEVQRRFGADLDFTLDGKAGSRNLLELAFKAASGRLEPKLSLQGNVDFQLTRGLLGISM